MAKRVPVARTYTPRLRGVESVRESSRIAAKMLRTKIRMKTRIKLDPLAIAPHPDDVELTSGGTLLKMADAGYRTGILDLTEGETGTRGTPEIRAREAARAAKILGTKVR